ncbi:MAG: hypothetical protein WCQ57_00265 [Verrucomicrobiota bacterium]
MKLLSACLAFVFAEIITALALGFFCSGLNTPVAGFALGIGAIVGVAAWRSTHDDPAPRAGIWDAIALSAFALVSLRAFLWLIYLRGDEICVLSPNNLGDMSLHLNFIRYLASGVPFWPESPILTAAPLSYPLGADLFNSLIGVCGGNTLRALVWTGLGGAALTGYALWRWGGAFGLAAFLCNGGLLGFAVLRTWQIEDFQSEAVWKNFFLSMFITQRGLLFALPAGLLLLSAWREFFFRSGRRILPPWLQGLLYAGMPLFSFHAFLFLSLILAAIFVGQKKSRRDVLVFVASAFLPATVCVVLVTGFFSASSGIRLEPSWILGGKGAMALLWNFGLTLPLVLILAVRLGRSQDADARAFVWAALMIFLICCAVIFTPWDWDNMKLMMWSWLVVAPYLWTNLIAGLHLPVRAAICFVLFFSGAVSLVGGLDARHGYTLARRSELDAWQHAIAGIPPGTRFACVPDYNHPLILLGRKVACGYEGHLWSHGLKFQKKLALLKSALAGQTAWPIAEPVLGVEWLALRQTDYSAARPPGELPPVGIGALYDLRPLFKRDSYSQAPLQLPPRAVD